MVGGVPAHPIVVIPLENNKLSREDLAKIVDWLEIPKNFAMLYGSLNGTLTAGEKHPFFTQFFILMIFSA